MKNGMIRPANIYVWNDRVSNRQLGPCIFRPLLKRIELPAVLSRGTFRWRAVGAATGVRMAAACCHFFLHPMNHEERKRSCESVPYSVHVAVCQIFARSLPLGVFSCHLHHSANFVVANM